MVGPSQQWTSLADGERPSKGMASSHKSRAGSARDGKSSRERKRGMGETGDRKKRKHHVAHRAAPATTATLTTVATAAAASSCPAQQCVEWPEAPQKS